MNEAGYIYILTNPSFKDNWVKIGKCSRSVELRLRELDTTAVPLPFEIFATMKTVKFHEAEKQIHRLIDGLTSFRIRRNREFFNINTKRALEVLEAAALTIDDAEIKVYKGTDGSETKEVRQVRPRFRFSMINIPIGSKLVFVPTGVEVLVADDDKIEYEGRLYKLSTFVKTYIPNEKRNPTGTYQGSKYFSYEGRILDDIRFELENRI